LPDRCALIPRFWRFPVIEKAVFINREDVIAAIDAVTFSKMLIHLLHLSLMVDSGKYRWLENPRIFIVI